MKTRFIYVNEKVNKSKKIKSMSSTVSFTFSFIMFLFMFSSSTNVEHDAIMNNKKMVFKGFITILCDICSFYLIFL